MEKGKKKQLTVTLHINGKQVDTLTEEKRARRMKAIKKAAIDLIIATEKSKKDVGPILTHSCRAAP